MGDDNKSEEIAEQLKRSNEEFIRDTPGVHKPGRVRPAGGKYGHPFHDRVADYIESANGQDKLKTAFMQGYNSQQQDKALAYLRSMGIINAETPTARINEFLAAWGIAPLDEQTSEDVTIDVGPVSVGEATMVTPDHDDEIIDAEIVED